MPETKYFVLVGRRSLQILESQTQPDGFRTREDAERWMTNYIQERRGTQSNKPQYSQANGPVHPQPVHSQRVSSQQDYRHDRYMPTPPHYREPLPVAPQAMVALPTAEQIVLSREQQYVLDLVKRGESVFFTGPAGTGKSVLLRQIVHTLRILRPGVGSLAITAPTGIAGINIGGMTIHSFAGIGLGKEEEKILARRIRHNQKMKKRWEELKTLIIDEISMLEGRLFDKLEYIARYVRGKKDESSGNIQLHEAPFGGIQLILSGDFCQLPPVPDESHQHRQDSSFCFDARTWSRCITRPPVRLTKVFRQKDNEFVDILSSMRGGDLSDEQSRKLASLSRRLVYEDGIEATELYPTRAEVDACNKRRLAALNSPAFTYTAVDRAGCDVRGDPIPREDAIKLLDRIAIVPSIITLKVGAQVMLIKNIVQGAMVNGSTGVILEFLTIAEAMDRKIKIAEPYYGDKRDEEDDKEAQYMRVVQRFTSPHNMTPINSAVFSRNQLFPLVRFTNGLLLLCAPVNFSVEGYIGNVECERLQVPLILAWAMSIHKSQGQTLTRVKVDLARIFEKGQTYVAISRATTMEHLEIQNFNPVKVQAHPRVLAWEAEWMPRAITARNHAAEPSGLPALRSNDKMEDWDEYETAWEESMVSNASQQKHTSREMDDEEMIWEEMDSEDAMNHYYSP